MTENNNDLTIGNRSIGAAASAALLAAINDVETAVAAVEAEVTATGAATVSAVNDVETAVAAVEAEVTATGAANVAAIEAAEASIKIANAVCAVASLGQYGWSNVRDDFTAAISSTTEIDLTSLPSALTVDVDRIVAIATRAGAGEVDWNWVYGRGSGELAISYAGGTITFSSAVLTVGYDVAVWIEGVGKYDVAGIDGTLRTQTRDEAFTVATESERVEEIDPLDTRGVADTIIDETNIADGTYYRYVSMDTYRKGFFQLEISGGSGTMTVSLEGTVQDEGVAPASRTYQDVGLGTFGAATWTADTILGDNAEKLAGYSYIRFKMVASTGAADDADITIYGVRLY
jgi:hypothetical protein